MSDGGILAKIALRENKNHLFYVHTTICTHTQREKEKPAGESCAAKTMEKYLLKLLLRVRRK